MALSVHLVKPVYKPASDYSLKAVREEVGKTLDIRTTDAGERGEEGEYHAEGGGQDEHVPAAFAPGSEVSAEPEPGAAVAVSSEEKESEIIEALTRHRLTDVIHTFVGAEVDAATVRELTKDEFGSWVSEVEFTTIQKKRLWKMFAEMHAHDTIEAMSELTSVDTKVAEIVAKKDSQIAAKEAELVALRAALSEAKPLHSGISKPSEAESVTIVKKASERRAVDGCPIFIEAVQEADFEKFKRRWAHRRELPAYVKFNGKNAMHWAARGNNVDVLQYLIVDGSIDVNAECDLGMTALTLAAMYGHSEAVRVLLTAESIRVDARSNVTSTTSLMQAAMDGKLSCVKVLVEVGGASLSIRDTDGRTALDLAKKYGYKETHTYLKSKAPKRKWF